jgi:hypothetical protein
MPPRHYRFALRNSFTSNRVIVIDNTRNYDTNSEYIVPLPQELEYSLFQNQLFEIVYIITQRLEINEITASINTLQKSISSTVQLQCALDIIETTSISIVKNFSDGIDIGIIACRIDYLRRLISNIPDSVTQEDYQQIGQLFLEVLGMITEGIDLSKLENKIKDIQSIMYDSLTLYNAIEEIRTVICSIVQNIADGVAIGIITCRVDYLRRLIHNLPQ